MNDATDTEKSIFVRWYGADGIAPNPEFLANVYTKDAQEHPGIGIDAGGDIVVAWQSINQATGTGVSWDVFARQFHPNGTSPQAQEFQVNETVAAPQRFPAVGVDAAGRFSIAWQTINQDGSSWAVFQRQYRADGTPETGEQIVNTVTNGPQIEPVFARSVLGNYDLFWSGTMANHVDGIGGRAFGINTVPSGPHMNGPGGPLSGPERQPIAIPLTITSADSDVAVTLSVVITGVPADATLSAGTLQSDGRLDPDSGPADRAQRSCGARRISQFGCDRHRDRGQDRPRSVHGAPHLGDRPQRGLLRRRCGQQRRGEAVRARRCLDP
ncbi:MAG: hypothetical protein U0791_09760 [Gemmataceae bacterium]